MKTIINKNMKSSKHIVFSVIISLMLIGTTVYADTLWTATGNNISNTNSGYLGIGTTNPTEQITLSGYGAISAVTGNSSGYLTHQYGSDSGNDYLSLGGNFKRTSGSGGSIGNSSMTTAEIRLETATNRGDPQLSRVVFATSHDINTAPIDRMLIDSYGYVGIGTTSPTQALDVKGNIKLTGSVVSDGDICIGTCL